MNIRTINIVEKDLFNFVFYPNYLATEKHKYISLNLLKYTKEIKLLDEIKKNLKTKVTEEIIEKILRKIEELQENTIIRLKKVIAPKLNSKLTLAADSPNINTYLNTHTFSDDESQFLVKVLNQSNDKKIFVFCKNFEKEKDLTIELEPLNEFHSITNQHEQFLVETQEEITGITIHLGKK